MSDTFERRKNTQASMITFGVGGVLLLIFFLVKFELPSLPPPVIEDGIEVNLGNSDFGSGKDQPLLPGEPAQSQQIAYNPPQQVRSHEENVKDIETDDKNAAAPEIVKPVISKPNATQINKVSKEVRTSPKTQPVVTEAPPRPKAVVGRTLGGNGNGGNGSDTYKPGTNEGIAGGRGDQGRPGGTPGGGNYTGTPKNFGVRVLQISNQSFQDEFNENAKVAMDVEADASGKVFSATYRQTGSTTSNRDMIDIAHRKAFQLKLGSSEGGQKGVVIFNFKLKN
jgi:hypothetical protein